MILILAKEKDSHAVVVQKHIENYKPKLRVEIVDTSLFPQKIAIETYCDQSVKHIFTLPNGSKFSSEEIQSVWLRRPQVAEISEEITGDQERELSNIECEYHLEGLFQSIETLCINNRVKHRQATRKVYQLQMAQKSGLRIPKTLITNNPTAVKTFWEQNDAIIYKPVQGIRDKIVQTTIVDKEHLAALDSIKFAPVAFQEFIPAEYDLRVTVVGNKIFTGRIESQKSKSKIDWRFDLGHETVPYELPQKIAEKILHYMQQMGLIYGAIDLRVTPQGEYVFFEVNPGGQYLFVEVDTKLPISQAIAELLIQGHV